jgi:hypothetical protein
MCGYANVQMRGCANERICKCADEGIANDTINFTKFEIEHPKYTNSLIQKLKQCLS